jgi:acetylornithine deacetylase/succinyl-diaminopimelate desuccinylase-like protein
MSDTKDRQLNELIELLKIESISAQSDHNKDVRKAANWLKKHLENIGIENCSVMNTAGHPVVYADWLNAPGKPTILIYGHYDVQSPDPIAEWKSPPFEPTVRNGNLYARGTADDKGQLFTHIKALESILSEDKELSVNVKFLIEGEEEVGGPSLDNFIKKHKKLLKADVCLISDTHALSPTQPLIDYGLKGLVYMQINLSTMPKDAHSGLYGGNIPNAAQELVEIVRKLKDEKTQEVLIPGFYKNVRHLSKSEINLINKSPFNKNRSGKSRGVANIGREWNE